MSLVSPPSRTVKVLGDWTDSMVARKLRQDLLHVDKSIRMNMQLQTVDQQRQTLSSNQEVIERFDVLVNSQQEHLATLLWQYAMTLQAKDDMVVLIHVDSPVLFSWSDVLTDQQQLNRAVIGDEYLPQSIHSSLLVLQKPDREELAAKVVQMLLYTPIDTLVYEPLFVSKKIYQAILHLVKEPLKPGRVKDWFFYEQDCSMDPFLRTVSSTRKDVNHICPQDKGYCCSIYDPWQSQVGLLSAHPILPVQVLPSSLPQPYNAEAGHYSPDELPYITTISEQVFIRPDDLAPTPNFFETLLQNECLPSDDSCSRCLREKSGANCHSCAKVCPCFCKALCHEKVNPKFVAKEWTIRPPRYARDPHRLVPRIVHQTWFEALDPERYPNMSRLVQSFQQSGWEYKFYSDDQAGNFLSTHFPNPVRQAYDTLRPGAFKADLFRYCVLLIHGGVYADVDILLESNLDKAIPPEIGFMVPIDEPGTPVNKRMCLWNGFIAASPGHPYLAKAIETVVNQVRNRFTSVDVDATFCPSPELSILHAFDTLFTAGPCLLGASINRVLHRHPQTGFAAGEVNSSQHPEVPGRTVILHQDKWDMGAHRFTYLDQNMVVCATDLQDADDRANNKQKGGAKTEHYSKTHAKTGIYGLENLYTDQIKANEDIRMVFESSSVSQI
jgi:Glycosyltransferase sugar-binding region containing DXD motif